MKVFTSFLLLFLICGCYTKKAAVRKFCHQDSAIAKLNLKIPVAITLPPDSLPFKVNDSAIIGLYNLLQIQQDSIICFYEDSLLNVMVYFNALNKTYLFKPKEKQGKTIHDTVLYPIEIKVPCNCPPPPPIHQPNWKDKLKMAMAISGVCWWVIMLIVAIIFIALRK